MQGGLSAAAYAAGDNAAGGTRTSTGGWRLENLEAALQHMGAELRQGVGDGNVQAMVADSAFIGFVFTNEYVYDAPLPAVDAGAGASTVRCSSRSGRHTVVLTLRGVA